MLARWSLTTGEDVSSHRIEDWVEVFGLLGLMGGVKKLAEGFGTIIKFEEVMSYRSSSGSARFKIQCRSTNDIARYEECIYFTDNFMVFNV